MQPKQQPMHGRMALSELAPFEGIGREPFAGNHQPRLDPFHRGPHGVPVSHVAVEVVAVGKIGIAFQSRPLQVNMPRKFHCLFGRMLLRA